jgi:hypothetical protein
MQAKTDIRELNSRQTSYGLSVALLWDSVADQCWIELETDEDWCRFEVPNDRAAEAFKHPFVARANAEGRSAAILAELKS